MGVRECLCMCVKLHAETEEPGTDRRRPALLYRYVVVHCNFSMYSIIRLDKYGASTVVLEPCCDTSRVVKQPNIV